MLRISSTQVESRPLPALGLDSLSGVELSHRLEEALGISLPVAEWMEATGLEDLGRRILDRFQDGHPADERPLAKASEEEAFALSHGQQALWFLHRLAPESGAYHIAAAARVEPRLDLEALRRALAGLAERHPALRTTFHAPSGEPRQRVHRELPPELVEHEVSPERAGGVAAELERAAYRPFDLAADPPVRVEVFRLPSGEDRVLLAVHHIVADFWSLAILVRELAALYVQETSGAAAGLSPLPMSYRDYVRFERERLAGARGEALWTYWRRRLAGSPSELALPTDRPRRSVQSFAGAVESLRLGPEPSRGLSQWARGGGCTLFMAALAVFQVLLARYTGRTDLVVGSPTAGRDRREFAGLVGYFVNPVVLRADLSGRPTCREFLGRVRQVVLEAMAHRDFPFPLLAQRLQPEREAGRAPLFQASFVLQKAPRREERNLAAFALKEAGARLELGGLTLTSLVFEERYSPFELVLRLAEVDGELAGSFQYSSDLFDAVTVLRMAGHFRKLLEETLARPEAPVWSLPLLGAAQRSQLLVEWNATAAEGAPGGVLLHRDFELRAAAAPEAVALIFETRHLTYRELNGRANQLAHSLRALIPGRGHGIGVSMDRSPELVVALLGILKSGSTYVPLEPDWPVERQRWILASLALPCLVTSAPRSRMIHELQWQLPDLAAVIYLDADTGEPPAEPVDAAAVRALWDHLAERAVDRAGAGGFVSSFTGAPMSDAEIDQYRDRVARLAGPYLGPGKRVLEVGCGSGLVLFEIAPEVGAYVAADPSEATQTRNRKALARRGLTHVELVNAFAHEIEAFLPRAPFDLVIMASVVQFFPGPFYLERVVKTLLRLLAPGGALLIADVPDARRKAELRDCLAEFRLRQRGTDEMQTKTRLDELFVDEGFFVDLAAGAGLVRPELCSREGEFENELRFRYDVLFRNSASSGEPTDSRRAIARRTGWHLRALPRVDPSPPPAEGIAYVIFTSGSTGAPKGVMVSHRPAAHLTRWVNTTFRTGPEDRALFVTSPCFDLSVYDVFGVLGAGAAIRMASAAELGDPARLARVLREERITFWDSAPAALEQLLPFLPAAGPGNGVPGVGALRLVFLSGDWIPVDQPGRIRRSFPAARVVALGGATEATVWSNFFPVGEVDPGWQSIPYGRPIWNVRYDVLDPWLASCPIGVAGDLFIGGECLAAGYAREPRLTAASFLPDSLSGLAGVRMYRTGDLARLRADGNIEFLGRADHQVKVRGFRIEPGEIETALAARRGVERAVVVARDDLPGGRGLVAFVVPQPGAVMSAGDLRRHLAENLPPAMVPPHFVFLEDVPVNANGKVDRSELRRRSLSFSAGDRRLVRTPAEERLARIFSELLRMEEVGADDGFFDLGGHSLLAARLVAEIRDRFAVELPMRAVFETPTVAGLALRIERARGAGRASGAPPIEPVARTELPPAEGVALLRAGPLSFAQERLWFLDRLEPASAAYNIPAAVRLAGALDAAALAASLGEIVRRHEALRTRFATAEGGLSQIVAVAPAGAEPLPLPRVDLRRLPAAARPVEARRQAAAEAARPFDLERGPLLRGILTLLGGGEHVLSLTMHHIVSDGGSLGVLARELVALYPAFSAGRRRRLPELGVQYADYAQWQRRWLSGAVLETRLGFWAERLRDLPPALDLPADRPRPPVRSSRGDLFSRGLSAELTSALRTLGRGEQVTHFVTALAAFAAVLGRHGAGDDVAVGTPVAGRHQPGTEELIGLFANTLVLRVPLGGDPTCRELLARVRERVLESFDHQDLPFQLLVDALSPQREPGRNPLFQVFFTMAPAGMPALDLPGVAAEPLEVAAGTAQFDLALRLSELPEHFAAAWEYRSDLFDPDTPLRLAAHFETLAAGMAADPGGRLSELPLLRAAERHQLLREWSGAGPRAPAAAGVHELFDARAARMPAAVAVVFRDAAVSYGELARRSDALALRLHRSGLRAGGRAGILVERSPEMVVALIGVLKAGAAYVPFDPSLPERRLASMVRDAGLGQLVAGERFAGGLAARLSPGPGGVVRVAARGGGKGRWRAETARAQPAYVIYTSGSTGRPKGVAVTHENLVSFMDAMDVHLGAPAAGVWLAVTTISFDISALELLWTLTRGFRVVVHEEREPAGPPAVRSAAGRDPELSLFFFADDDRAARDKYRLLLESARFADRRGFRAVWTPERHFHPFGGLYPNPSVTGAAVAAVTERIAVRAGSVVLPLHDPIRVAEEWSVVDNLSGGRVGISFASGWHTDDFVLAPESFAERRQALERGIDTVRRLWRGESVARRGGAGRPVEVSIRPRPVQPELPVWLTAAGNPETFRLAGRLGANVLTHLLGQELVDLEQKIALYRRARAEAGHAAGSGIVTVMLHTFLGSDEAAVREQVWGPFEAYLRSSFDLLGKLARSSGMGDVDQLSESELRELLSRACERFYGRAALFGTPDSCRGLLARLGAAGADEIGCLIDFGVDTDAVLAALEPLDELRRASRARRREAGAPIAGESARSVGELIDRHRVTHLQCTPTLAAMLAADPGELAALGSLAKLLLGGEVLPRALAQRLRGHLAGELLNLYGPTEATVWSLVHPVTPGPGRVPVGRALGNTEVLVADRRLGPAPVGVAGEIVLGGWGIAAGYWRRPRRTAESFCPDPFARRAGARLYRTGDRACHDRAGVLRFLGRRDHQVKLRGHRVELGEVEAALAGHPAVAEAVAAVREDRAQDVRLVAYLVPAAGQAPRLRPRADSASSAAPNFTLPNGLRITAPSEFQARAAYREIFEDDVYFRHGVTLGDGACVFDVGANIGLFTLRVHERYRRPRVFAFEPIPPTFAALRANLALYGLDVALANCGMADRPGRAEFTFYPRAPGLSGRFAGTPEVRAELRATVVDWLGKAAVRPEGGVARAEVDDLLDEYLESQRFTCDLVTVSDVIREHGVDRIDLVKIDAERSELDVLRGIRDEDWPRIDQLVLEVHTRDLLEESCRLLRDRGYELAWDEVVAVDGPEGRVHVTLLYARSPALAAARGKGDGLPPALSTEELRRYLGDRLPPHMVPADFVVMEELPRTRGGKVDRRSLPAPSAARPALATEFVAPRSGRERALARIWHEVLGRERLGIDDNFFEVGGNSLLLVEAQRRLKEAGLDLTMVQLFRNPTLRALARFLETGGKGGRLPAAGVAERAQRGAEAPAREEMIERRKRFLEARRTRKPGLRRGARGARPGAPEP